MSLFPAQRTSPLPGGYMGKILRVDLTTGELKDENLPDESILKKFIGGQALALYILMNELPLNATPFGPENKVVMMTGPLTGNGFTPGGTKMTAVYLSPLTNNTLGRGATSGYWGTYLKAAGYNVVIAHDGGNGLALARREKPDLIVLDLMLPEMDGFDVCREIRKESDVPIIMLTAHVEEMDKLIGLELGADDYLTKPFSPRELVARVKVVLRRVGPDSSAEVIRVGDVSLNRAHYQVQIKTREVTLTPTEFEILATLMSQPGRIFSRSQLLNAAHGVAFESYERAIDSHIRNLRRKLEPDDFIVTVHGVGYKFEEQ